MDQELASTKKNANPSAAGCRTGTIPRGHSKAAEIGGAKQRAKQMTNLHPLRLRARHKKSLKARPRKRLMGCGVARSWMEKSLLPPPLKCECV